ncbi:MAG: hypothetical protein COA33_013750 [Fluviicola sp.]|nr:hypothetical protein [Fluviicola sp.]
MAFNRLNHSVLGEIRPRFKLKINFDAEMAMEKVSEDLLQDKTVAGERSQAYIFVKTPRHHQHYWSPEMSVRIEQEEYDDYTTVSCLVGPRQTVWAMFTFMYAVIFIASTFGGIFSIVKYTNNDDKSWLWIIPLGIICTASVFLVSKFGQKKGRDQMLHLVSFIYHSLEKFTEVKRIEED